MTKAIVKTEMTDTTLKIKVKTKTPIINGKPMDKAGYQEIKKEASELGMATIGKTLKEMKKHIEEHHAKKDGVMKYGGAAKNVHAGIDGFKQPLQTAEAKMQKQIANEKHTPTEKEMVNMVDEAIEEQKKPKQVGEGQFDRDKIVASDEFSTSQKAWLLWRSGLNFSEIDVLLSIGRAKYIHWVYTKPDPHKADKAEGKYKKLFA